MMVQITCGDGDAMIFLKSWHDPAALTIGWYNMKTQPLTKDNAEANFEIQLNFNTNELKLSWKIAMNFHQMQIKRS